MAEQKTSNNQIENDDEEEEPQDNDNTNTDATNRAAENRNARRKAAKREKRKKKRKELAEIARREEEARLADPEEWLRLQAEEESEKSRIERERLEFEERERKILEDWERKRIIEEEERERKAREEEEEFRSKQNQIGFENEEDEDGWEYVEEGPPEIIWQGNEIIVKKKKVKVKKKEKDQQIMKEDPNRPTSNPLPPQSEAFADYKNEPVLSAQQLLENVAQETPNFGTEQDKAHCPFHLKTGACRFGTRCSRIHFYPDKSCTLLIKNMYNGPGLAWEQDEGLEHTDEEVERAYEEFYEDVHTEFLKFGEIVNFKVCRNGSSHLRGNVYVHYKSLDAAVLAYQSLNGRYFAGKQLNCEYIGVTRWKVAICGEFMKSKLQTCTRGMTCNFIHCFRNPGGDYEWADWDKPPPRYWLKEMAALFGSSYELGYEINERESSRLFRSPSRTPRDDSDRCHPGRSQSREIAYSSSSRNYDDTRRSRHRQRSRSTDRKRRGVFDAEQCHNTTYCTTKQQIKSSTNESGNDYDNSRNPSRSRSINKLETRERDRAHKYKEQSLSPMSNCSVECEDKKSKRRRVHKMKHSSVRDNVGSKWDGEVEHDNGKPSNRSVNYKSSNSRSRCSSREDVDRSERWESEHDHRKKSNGKRDRDRNLDSESRAEYYEANKSHAADYDMDEDTDERGRWGT